MLRSVLLIGVLATMTTCCLGFVVDRSAPTWDPAPSLDPEQIGALDRVLNGKIQLTGMDKVLQVSDTKKSSKHAEEPSPEDPPREKRSEILPLTLDKVSRGTRSPKDIVNVKNSSVRISLPIGMEEMLAMPVKVNSNVPENVVLLLIDEAGEDRDSLWKSFTARHSFPVQGTLESCRNGEPLPGKYFLGDTITSDRKGNKFDCECEHFLRSNVGSLLSWAHHAKEMTTGAVSATNFSIPTALGYEGPPGIAKETENVEDNSVKRETKRSKPELRDAWRVIDLDKQPGIPSVTPAKQDGTKDGMWDVFDMFSRIRIAFFRTLLDSLGGNLGGPEDGFNPRRPFPLQPSLMDLVGDTIKELKSVSNDKGYMLVAVAPANELSPAVELLQQEISPKDTLLVVAGICSPDKKSLPFFAHGPGAKALYQARTIWDLPQAVKNAVTAGCHGPGCRIRRNEAPLPLAQGPVPTKEGPISKRVIREDNVKEVKEPLTSAKNPRDGDPPADAAPALATGLQGNVLNSVVGLAVSFVATVALSS